jgi:hypothetical protein
MDLDYFFVGGLLLGVLSVLAILSALVEGRFPKLGALLLILGIGSVGFAIQGDVSKYSFEQIPEVVSRVAGKLF